MSGANSTYTYRVRERIVCPGNMSAAEVLPSVGNMSAADSAEVLPSVGKII